MGDKSRIEWTDATWNPFVGCSKVSPGCANCYAERQSKRTRPGVPFDVVTLHENRMPYPEEWSRPRKIFVGSMSDLFHRAIPDDYRDRVFLETILAGRHTFQIPTKRIEEARDYLIGLTGRPSMVGAGLNAAFLMDVDYPSFAPVIPMPEALDEFWPLRNVWIGASVENQTWADRRIPVLLDTPAAIRFLSIEPLLGPIAGRTIQTGIDWAIVGGESGPNCRPMNLEWARVIRQACYHKRIPFFMKQIGGWPKKLDALEDFPLDLQVREYPRTQAA